MYNVRQSKKIVKILVSKLYFVRGIYMYLLVGTILFVLWFSLGTNYLFCTKYLFFLEQTDNYFSYVGFQIWIWI